MSETLLLALAGKVTASAHSRFERVVRMDGEIRACVWVYKSTIYNDSTKTIQLRGRHWWIYTAGGEEQQVDAPTVRGEWPTIKPGGLFPYVSAVPLPSHKGTMRGYFDAVLADDPRVEFQIEVPLFKLDEPNAMELTRCAEVGTTLPGIVQNRLKESVSAAQKDNSPWLINTAVLPPDMQEVTVNWLLADWKYFNVNKAEFPDLWFGAAGDKVICGDIFLDIIEFNSSWMNVEILNPSWLKPKIESGIVNLPRIAHTEVAMAELDYYIAKTAEKAKVSVEDLREALKDIQKRAAAATKHELTAHHNAPAADGPSLTLPERAPKLYADRPKGQNIVDFLRDPEGWGPYVAAGVLSRPDFRRYDPEGEMALRNFLRNHALPDDMRVPTKSEAIDALVARGVVSEPMVSRIGQTLARRHARQKHRSL